MISPVLFIGWKEEAERNVNLQGSFVFENDILECAYYLFYISRFTSVTQPAFTCSKLTIETLEQGVKYVQN